MKKYYDLYKKDDKHFFAGLFNTAVNNFDLSIRELERRIKSKSNNSIGVLKFAFSNERPFHELENNFNFLKESLVFMNEINGFYNKKKTNKDIPESQNIYLFTGDFLVELYNTLNSLRNYYTHYEHSDIEIGNDIADFLNDVLFHSAIRIKKDRAKNADVKARLKTKYKTEIDEYFKAHNNKGEVKHKIKQEDKTNYVINKMFNVFFYEDKDKNIFELKNLVKTKNNETNRLTKSGIALVLSLFLTKKQINLLFDNFKYFYDDDSELQKLIIRWVYTYRSYKSIRYLFKSDYDTHSLLLQMVNELNKAPKHLYPYLSEAKKKEFIEDVNIYLKDNAKNYDDSLVAHEVIRRRYEEKFAYFALRFLDDFIEFPTLRFHVNLGKFNHNSMKKTYKNNLITERSILEKINVFEKLTMVTKKKKEYFQNNNIDTEEGWREFPMPKYVFHGNSIGIYLGKRDEVEMKREENKPTKTALIEKLGLPKDAYQKPMAFLSVYELPALLHYLLVDRKTPKEVEEKITQQINKQKKELNSIDESNISDIKIKKDISINNKIIRKLTKINDLKNFYDLEKIKKIIEEEIKISDPENEKSPLKEIRKNYKKTPKNPNILSNSEKGKIATWLSKDIKRFTKKEVRENWKGYQFAEFQSLLSYYDIDKNAVKNFLLEDLYENKNLQNNFLLKNLNFNNITLYEFYIDYLTKRNTYLEKKLLLKLLQGKDKTDEIFVFLPKNKFVLTDIKNYKIRKNNAPIMLSRGIFYDEPTGYKPDDYNKKNELAEWFTKASDIDKAQEFYKYQRQYPIDDNNFLSINTDKGLKDQFSYFEKTENNGYITKTIDKKQQKFIYKNEAKIRRTMRNDYYILQMIKHFYKESTEIDKQRLDKITLKDFYLTKAEKEKIQKEASEKQNEFNQDFILRKKVEISMYEGKIKGEVKLKESGKYKRLLLDSKVKMLTEYFPDKKWTIDDIMLELDNYEQVRSKEFFKNVHQLEQIIYTKADEQKELEKLLLNGFPNFRKYLVYYYECPKLDNINVIKTKLTDLETEKEKLLFILIMLRNKFAHNQLVPKEIFVYLQEKYTINKNEKIGTYLNRVFEKIYEELNNN